MDGYQNTRALTNNQNQNHSRYNVIISFKTECYFLKVQADLYYYGSIDYETSQYKEMTVY